MVEMSWMFSVDGRNVRMFSVDGRNVMDVFC